MTKKTFKIILKAIADRQSQKKGRNLRTIRLTPESKTFLIKGGFLQEEGHFYTGILPYKS